MNLTAAELEKAVGGNFFGCVGYSRKRAVYRNLKQAYVKHMEKEMQEDYLKLLVRFEIIPKPGIAEILAKWFRKFLSGPSWKEDSVSVRTDSVGGEVDACSKIPS